MSKFDEYLSLIGKCRKTATALDEINWLRIERSELRMEVDRMRAQLGVARSDEPLVVPATVVPGNFAGVRWNSCCRQYRNVLDKAGIKWVSEAAPEPEEARDATLTDSAGIWSQAKT